MPTAQCPMPNPPSDCPLLRWRPTKFLCWFNAESQQLEKVPAIECEICSMLWTPEGETVDKESLQ